MNWKYKVGNRVRLRGASPGACAEFRQAIGTAGIILDRWAGYGYVVSLAAAPGNWVCPGRYLEEDGGAS